MRTYTKQFYLGSGEKGEEWDDIIAQASERLKIPYSEFIKSCIAEYIKQKPIFSDLEIRMKKLI